MQTDRRRSEPVSLRPDHNLNPESIALGLVMLEAQKGGLDIEATHEMQAGEASMTISVATGKATGSGVLGADVNWLAIY
jgi:hypothetical protein